MSNEFWVNAAAEYLRTQEPAEAILVSYVTDDVLQLVVTFPAKYSDETVGAWSLALAVDSVASLIEEKTGSPFASFVLAFTQAWAFRSAMKVKTRKGHLP